jgi:hypothetical protein
MKQNNEPYFYLDGRPVFKGQVLYIKPKWHQEVGESVTIEYKPNQDNQITVRCDNGAVPTIPIIALSWSLPEETRAREDMRKIGITSPTDREVSIWLAAKAYY